MLSTIAAIAVLGERPSALALLGAMLVALSVFALAKPARSAAVDSKRAISFGVITGILIAGYTLCDKQAVGAYGVPPLFQQWGTSVGMSVMLAPLALKQRAEIRHHLQHHLTPVLAIGVLVPTAYILVLTAMSFTPISYIAPAREVEHPVWHDHGHAPAFGGSGRQAHRGCGDHGFRARGAVTGVSDSRRGSTGSLSSGGTAEDAFVDFSQRLAADEAVESLEAEGEFREGKGSLPPEATVAQADQILFISVFRAVDDAEVLAAAAFQGRLRQTATALVDEAQRFDDHALATLDPSVLPTRRCPRPRPRGR